MVISSELLHSNHSLRPRANNHREQAPHFTWYEFIKSPYLALEARLMSLYFDTKQYNMCLKLGQRLYSELKKLDDKALLVEIQLTESKVSQQL